MEKKKFPLPKKFWVYVSIIIVLFAVIFANIFIMAAITGEKELWQFNERDWMYFCPFAVVEILLVIAAFVFAQKAGKINANNLKKIEQYYSQIKYAGINQEDYDYVWFSFGGYERALISEENNVYKLYVEHFDKKEETWVRQLSHHNSLDEIKEVLYYKCNFLCEENAELAGYAG